MGEKRSYSTVKKEYDSEGLRKLAKKLTETYVNSDLEYSQTQVAEDNNVTVSCLRKLMDLAISEAIVSRKTAERVERKSIANQQRKHSEAGGSSVKHHKHLMDMRNEYIVKMLTVTEVEEIVKSAVAREEQFENVLDIYKKLETKRVLYLVFERAVENIIATDEEAEMLMSLIQKKYPGEKAINFCNRLRKERKETQEMLS